LGLAGATQGKLVHETWDAAYLQGSKAGFVQTTVTQTGTAAEPLLRTEMKLQLNVKRFNTQIQLRMDTGTEETRSGKVLGVFMRQYLGTDKKLDLTGKVVGKQLRLVLDGTKPLQPAPWDDKVLGLYRQQSLFRDRNVKPGDAFTYRSFEPSINLVVTTSVKVKDWETVEMFGGQTKKKLLRVETTPEKVENVQLPTLVTWLDDKLEPVRSQVEIPGLGLMTLYRTTRSGATTGSSVATLTDIGVNQFITLNRRIIQPNATKNAVYRIKLRGVEDPQTAFSRDLRQTVKNVQGDTFELHVKAGAAAQAEKVDDEFLQSSYFINCADAKVKSLARLAVGAEQDSWRKALRIEKWVHDNMRGVNDEALATADHVARTLQGDCTEYAMLMAAMCRAEGVPARTAIGLIYADLPRGPVFSFHMWTEVWIKGRWLPLDATLGQGSVGATHLKITDHSWHNMRHLAPLLPLLRVMGKVSIEVVSAGNGPG
jgi:hypothetical protein